jgi:hypothetical protein
MEHQLNQQYIMGTVDTGRQTPQQNLVGGTDSHVESHKIDGYFRGSTVKPPVNNGGCWVMGGEELK